ncbi:MAG: hypothetical protein KC656_02050 [Myxococcales bacterium]|nr:hypothetical protein [Myxococcales bacterium]
MASAILEDMSEKSPVARAVFTLGAILLFVGTIWVQRRLGIPLYDERDYMTEDERLVHDVGDMVVMGNQMADIAREMPSSRQLEHFNPSAILLVANTQCKRGHARCREATDFAAALSTRDCKDAKARWRKLRGALDPDVTHAFEAQLDLCRSR